MPDAGIAQFALQVRDDAGVGGTYADGVVNIFFVPLHPVGHATCLCTLIERRVKLFAGQRQLTAAPLLRHRPTPVIKQRLAVFRAKHHRLDRRPLHSRLTKRRLHKRH